MIVIADLMRRLASRRPVFCSEADFQHEIANEIRVGDPGLNIRLEWPLPPPARGAIDIIVIGGSARFALELKYLCKGLSTTIDGDPVTLKNQSAHDHRSYDVCKDVTRMEAYANRTGFSAGVLVLSNDPNYWQERLNDNSAYKAFRLSHARELGGELLWGATAGEGTTEARQQVLSLEGRYPLAWHDYSQIEGRSGLFRYLWIPVEPTKAIPAVSG